MILLRANFKITVIGYSENLIEHRLAAEAIRDRNPQAARTALLRLLTNNENTMTRGKREKAG